MDGVDHFNKLLGELISKKLRLQEELRAWDKIITSLTPGDHWVAVRFDILEIDKVYMIRRLHGDGEVDPPGIYIWKDCGWVYLWGHPLAEGRYLATVDVWV